MFKKTNKDGKSANPTLKTPIFVGNKAAEGTIKATKGHKKAALRKMVKAKC